MCRRLFFLGETGNIEDNLLDKNGLRPILNFMNNKEEQIKAVVRKLWCVVNKFTQVEKQRIAVSKGVELTTKEIHSIQLIGECEKINVSEVGIRFGVTKGAASQIISRLVKKGFVNKKVSAHSNKEFELSLTESGWHAYRVHESLHGKEMNEIMAQIKLFSYEQICHTAKILEVFDSVADKRLKKQ